MSLLNKSDIKIGHKIKFYRAKYKISQEELADKVDISSKTISNIERNEVVASKSFSHKKFSKIHLEKVRLLILKLEALQYMS